MINMTHYCLFFERINKEKLLADMTSYGSSKNSEQIMERDTTFTNLVRNKMDIDCSRSAVHV